MQRLVPQLVQRAAEMLGGMDALAKYLGVQEHAVHLWLAGRANAPNGALLSLVDLILKDDLARAQEDRRQQPRYGADSDARRADDHSADA